VYPAYINKQYKLSDGRKVAVEHCVVTLLIQLTQLTQLTLLTLRFLLSLLTLLILRILRTLIYEPH
jgi:hypothetical protein